MKSGSNIYVLSAHKLDTDTASSDSEASSSALNAEVQAGIVSNMPNFSENFDPQDFSTVYSLKSEVTETLQKALIA